MSELVDWINARLDEDEATARAASAGGWSYPGIESVAGGLLYDSSRTIAQITWDNPGDHDGSIVRFLPSEEADANGAHIARHDPARVLAEVNAKRAIVAKYVRASEAFDQMINPATSAAVMVLTEVVESLASVWVDAPGFREEWR